LKSAWTSWVLLILILLSFLDGSLGFMTSGSAYLWKDLFVMSGGQFLLPAWLQVIASLAPIIGLIISVQLLWIGIHRLAFCSAVVAGVAFAALSFQSVRLAAGMLLFFIMAVESTYGPLTTCTSLITAESFPTELRASGFAIVSVTAKVSGILASTLVEFLKADETADSWDVNVLTNYILSLLAATVLFAILVLMTPAQNGEGKQLRDFVRPVLGKRTQSFGYGATNSWAEPTDSDSDSFGDVTASHSMPA